MRTRGLGCLRGALLAFLLSAHLPGIAAAQSPQNSPILRLNTSGHGAVIFGLATSADGKRLATASYDRTIRLWSLPALEPLAKISLPAGTDLEGAAYAIAYSPDGKTLVTSGRTGAWGEERPDGRGPWCLYVIDIEKPEQAEIKRAVCDVPRIINDMAFSRDGAYLAVGMQRGFGVRIYRASDFSVAAEDREYGTRSLHALDFAADGRVATAGYDGFVRIYDKSFNGSLTPKVKGAFAEGRTPDSVSFSPDGSLIAVGYTTETTDGRPIVPAVHILSTTDLTVVATLNTSGVDNGALWRVVWSSDGKSVYAGGSWKVGNQYVIRRWGDAGRGQPQDIAAAPHPIVRMVRMASGGVSYAAEAPYLGTIGADDLEPRLRKPSLADFKLVGNALGVSSDGSVVQFAFEANGNKVAHFNVNARLLTMGPAAKGTVVNPRAVDRDVLIANWFENDRPTLNGQLIKGMRPDEGVLSFDIVGGKDNKSFVLGTLWNLRRYTAQGDPLGEIGVPYAAHGVVTTPNGKVVVAALGDGTIRWFATRNETDAAAGSKGLKEILAFFPHPDGRRWVAWTPSGYYMASADGGDELIGWQVNRGRDRVPSFYNAGHFRRLLYRPDIVRRTLAELDEAKAVRHAELGEADGLPTGKGVGSRIAKSQPPVLRIDSPTGDQPKFSGDEVTIKFSVGSPSGTPVQSVYAKIGGQAVKGAKTSPLSVPKGTEKSGILKVRVPPQDKVTISLVARTRDSESPVQEVTLFRESPIQVATPRLRPKAYVLAIGVGRYRQEQFTLRPNFPRHDVDAFAEVLNEQRTSVFGQIEFFRSPSGRLTLKDEEATRLNIENGLRWLQSKGEKADRDDILIFYFVGHGKGPYLYPFNYNGSEPQTTRLSKARLLETFYEVNPRVVIFVDACQALDGFDAVGLVMDAKRSPSGVIAVLSSARDQLAWGDDKGYFTTAVVEALRGRGLAANVPYVRTSDIDAHFARRMPDLTTNRQTARVYLNDGVDHVILAKRPAD